MAYTNISDEYSDIDVVKKKLASPRAFVKVQFAHHSTVRITFNRLTYIGSNKTKSARNCVGKRQCFVKDRQIDEDCEAGLNRVKQVASKNG
jgi:hypothetical protein